MESFLQLDWQLFSLINEKIANPYLDGFFRFITNLHREVWMVWGFFPLLVILLFWRFRWWTIKAVVVCALAIGLCDFINHRVVKPAIGRERPFVQRPTEVLLKLDYAPRGYSFPSNHALNCAAGATVLSYFFPASRVVFTTIAVLVALSRPYLGVHFPSDIFIGILMGWGVATIILRLFRRFFPNWMRPA